MDDIQTSRKKSKKGYRCLSCGHRKFAIQDGLRYCKNCGTQAEGFVQYDIGDEVEAGQTGRVARRQKEERERQKRHLRGQQGRRLYLEALQLILRYQVSWLVQQKHHIDELESVVRDLWVIRIRGFPEEIQKEDEGHEDLETFSSQPVTSETDDDTEKPKRSWRRAKSWEANLGTAWPLPKFLDTLALCYLACLLLRLPTSVSDIFRWANDGDMPFREAYHSLPVEVRERMPAEYTKILKLYSRELVPRTQLHGVVLDLVHSYHLNYSMKFPRPDLINTLVERSSMLALPAETAVIALHLSSILSLDYRYDTEKSRVHIIDNPEIKMTAILVVAAKLCYAVDDEAGQLLKKAGLGGLPHIDWHQWADAIAQQTLPAGISDHPKLLGEAGSHDQGFDMERERDGHFLASFFPQPPQEHQAPLPKSLNSDGHIERTGRALRQSAGNPTVISGEETRNSGYISYHNAESLPATASSLYEVAAEAAGVTQREMAHAVRTIEATMVAWERSKA